MKRTQVAWAVTICSILLVIVVAWLAVLLWPCSKAEIARTDMRVVARSRYVLLSGGKALFYFNGTRADTLIAGFVSQKGGFVTDTVDAQWVKRWALLPFCGESLEVQPVDTDAIVKMSHSALHRLLTHEKTRVEELQATMAEYRGDVDYYLKTHSVIDNGFEIVQRYSRQLDNTRSSLDAEVKLLTVALRSKHLSVRYERTYSFLKGAPDNSIRLFGWRFSRIGRKTAMERLRQRVAQRPKIRKSIVDSLGVYEGPRDSLALPHGYGRYIAINCSYYEGEWSHGEYDGVGFYMTPGKRLRIGEWKKSRFLGERVTYTPNRIYGIDISRYQHEKGRKRFSINWRNLRITSLGHASKKKISGVVDYPVRFIYIKATEGIRLRNKYFPGDYTMSKKTGHRTGAYHFYVPRLPGGKQAINFLRNARYRKGDLPPVLDLEPTEKQIKKIGERQLFINVQAWLNTVERHWGVRPVLYVGQKFVNRHLGAAPYLKRHYNIWIARYGEYKPDINLLYWQLCQDGRVKGIATPVDINVLNGFQLP